MGRAEWLSVVAVVIAVSVGVATAFAGSQGSQLVDGVPVFALCVALAFAVQWVAFVPAYLRQTERYFDLVGSLTFVSVMVVAMLLSSVRDERSLLVLVLVTVWAARLGSFLFGRMLRTGKDGRFDVLKPSALRFLAVWTIQGLWVSLTLAPALVAITSSTRQPLGLLALLGLAVWLVGFAIEAVADRQKSRFRSGSVDRERFIDDGLWSWSRHPNYFGEIVLWSGIALLAVPVLSGWQWLVLISPLFVALLLLRISGVPLLERKADERWGGQPDYESYKARTPVLIPRPPAPTATRSADRALTAGSPQALRSVLEWWFRDRRSGRILVAHVPNLPILLWMGTVIARQLVERGSQMHTLLEWAATVTLGWWAIDELVRGVNPWRRVLGIGGCVVVILGLVERLA